MRQSNTDRSAYGNPNCDGISDGNSDIHPDGDCNCNAYSNTHGNSNCHSNVDGDCDRTATPYTDATASTITDSTPLAFFGITGTRENELASSPPKVDRLAAATVSHWMCLPMRMFRPFLAIYLNPPFKPGLKDAKKVLTFLRRPD